MRRGGGARTKVPVTETISRERADVEKSLVRWATGRIDGGHAAVGPVVDGTPRCQKRDGKKKNGWRARNSAF